MKDSGIEWIGEIPEDWEIIKSKYLCNMYTGNSIKDEEKDNYKDSTDAHPYIATKDIDAIYGTADYRNGVYIKNADTSFKVAHSGCTLMCIEGGSAGKKKTYLTEDVSFVNKLCCFEAHNIFSKYLFYYLLSPNFEEQFKTNIGGLIGGVSVSLLKNFYFAVPSTEQQHRIADFLDDKCGKIDRYIEKQQQIIDKLKEYKQAVITEAVTKGLNPDVPMKDSGIEWIGMIPEHWKVMRIKNLLKERNERSEDGIEEPLSMSQKLGLIPTKFMDTIPNIASSFIGAKLAYVNDLVFNKLKAHLGVFSVSHYDGLVSPDYAVYYSTGLANLKYLEYTFKTPQCICEFRKKSSGIADGLTRLYTSGLFSIYVPFPCIMEQNSIAKHLETRCSEIDSAISKQTSIIEKLTEYKKSLIYEAVTGKLEV